MKIKETGSSEYTMAEIQQKSSLFGFSDSLTKEMTALAKDADLSAKAATGKLKFADALKDSEISTKDLGDALKTQLKESGEKDWLKELADAAEQGGETYQNKVKEIIESSDELANAFIKVEQAEKSTSIFSSAANFGKGLVASLKSVIVTFGPYIAGIMAVVAAFKLWDSTQTKYTKAQDKLSESSSAYEQTKSELQSLNSQLDETKSKIDQLESTGNLSFTDEVELEKLKKTSDELQRQIDLKQSLADTQAKQVAKDAKTASETKQSYTEAMRDEHGWLMGTLMGLSQNYSYADQFDDFGNATHYTTPLKEWEKQFEGDTTVEGQMEANIETLKDYQKQLEEVQEKRRDDSSNKELEAEEKRIQDEISNTTDKLSEQTDTIQGWIDKSKDANGNVIKGLESRVRDWNTLLTKYQNVGKSQSEIDLNGMTNFLTNDSSSKKYFEDIIKNGGTAQDVLEAFKKTGLSLDDIGVSSDGFIRYFKDIEKQAKQTADAVDDVNNSLTMSDVSSAFESANAGDDYVNLNTYLKKAKDLFGKGLVGTDDFKSVAEMISYNVDSSTESFTRNYERLQRYFTEDSDGNLTAGGVNNFLTDLKALNKGYAEFDENTQSWKLNMSNTAQAAKDMDMSVQSFEAMLGRIQDYDNVGDFKFTSAVKEFNDAKSALSELQSIYESMDRGSDKGKLKIKLDQWTPMIEAAENDLASLPHEVITQIKFEYDKAQLKQTADEAYDAAKLNGFSDSQSNVTAITAARNYQNELLGDHEISSNFKEKIPVYFDADNAIADLEDQLANGNLDQDAKVKVQADILSLEDSKNKILEAFENAHPEITPETDTATFDAKFNEWLDSEEGKRIVTKIEANSDDAFSDIKELTGKNYKTKVNVDADTSKAEEKIDELTKKGSVDLTNRPQVKASVLADMGYENTGDPNSTATVFSSGFSTEDGKKTVVVTPILPNGDVLEPGALEEYANEILDSGKDSQGIEIRTYYGDDSIEKSNRYAAALHEVQDAYYLGNDAQKKALSSLSEYTEEQLKAINLSDDQSSAMEDSMTSLMDSLNIGKDSLSEFVDVLSDMGLIKIDVDDSDAKKKLSDLSSEEIADKVVKLVGEDNASAVVAVWQGLQADDKFTSLTAEDKATTVTTLWAAASADPKFTSLSANDQATFIIGLWNGLNPEQKEAVLNADPGTLMQVAAAASAALDDVDSKNPDPTIKASDMATSVANSVSATLASLDGKTAHTYVYTDHIDTYSSSGSGNKKSGTKKLEGTVYANGTVSDTGHFPKLSARALAMGTLQDDSFLRDSWKTAKTEVALTGEKGPEIVIPPNSNRWYTVGDQGAEFTSIPAGSVVFNHKQTEELLTKGRTNSRAKGNPILPGLPSSMAYLQGTAHLGTSSGGFSFGGGAKKYNQPGTGGGSSSGSSSPNTSNNNNTSNTNSDTSSKAEETKETLDWIETELDRIKRNIDLVDKTASSTYKNWSKRNEALVSELSQVSNELNVQQQAYDRYIQQANSVGLSEDWASKVRDGRIDIETITDSDLKDKISDYKTW